MEASLLILKGDVRKWPHATELGDLPSPPQVSAQELIYPRISNLQGKSHCPNQKTCMTGELAYVYPGPDGRFQCLGCAKDGWNRFYQNAWRSLQPEAPRKEPRPKGKSAFLLNRRAGVLVRFPGCATPVKSTWTPTKIYPYKNLRDKHGLDVSYEPDEVEILNWGRRGKPDTLKEETK